MGGVTTILIIDDDDSVRRASRRILETRDFQVLEAPDGESGLRTFREHAPTAVLLDLRMPGMDGLDVLRELVAESPETPVIVVSGESTMSDAVEALRRGAWDFISKPLLDSEILVRGIRRGLEKASLLRQNREYSERLCETNDRLTDALEELRADEQAARQLQFQLLPEDGLRIGPYTCFRRLFPSQVQSGDFLDYFPLGDRFAALYLADVAGHGAASAFVTAILTTLVDKYRESFASHGDETILNPQQLLGRLDGDLAAHRLEKHITMFFGVLEIASGRLVYGSAGAFPFPFVGTGSDVIELECAGRPLNLPGEGRFGQGEVRLTPGARLLIASDGVLELPPKRTHREVRAQLATLTRSARDIDTILTALTIGESTHACDDVALLFIRREDNHA
jgi:sigma-B regulation protein RsbU (phosphoserine phosphatase)